MFHGGIFILSRKSGGCGDQSVRFASDDNAAVHRYGGVRTDRLVLYDYAKIVYVNRIVRCLKTNLYRALYHKELNVFLSEKNGHYLSLYSKDIDLVVDNYLMPKCNIISNILSAVVCLLSIFIINWKLGLSFVTLSGLTVVLSQIRGQSWRGKQWSTHSITAATWLCSKII